MQDAKLNDRQKEILTAIVEQYAEVASPVGSLSLAKTFGVSSATIRSEMATLESAGYIRQPYTSAGRIPTDKGYRFFVNQINDNSSPGQSSKASTPTSSRSLTAVRSRVESAGTGERMIKNAVDTLVGLTENLGLGTIGNQIYLSGMSKLFSQPEFSGSGGALAVAGLLDNLEPWLRETKPNSPLSVYIGRENPIGASSGCSLIVSRYNSPYSDNSYVGVIGPTRQSYRQVMGLVENTGRILEAVVN